jgi:tetratricopeptide (TPR) repeat protein
MFQHLNSQPFLNMKKIFLLASLFLGLFAAANAQIKTPQPSPTCKLSQDLGLIKVDVEYSRPSAKSRKVFGDLVPFGQMWRTGANASTKVTVSEDAMVGGVSLKKGTYALYSIPGDKDWTIIFYKNTSFWGVPEPAEYKEEDVAAKFTATAMPLRDLVESFTLNFNNLRNNGGDLELSWENTKVVIPFTVDTDGKVMSAIKTTMEGPSANDYYAAARYYYEEKKDMLQALIWVDQSLEKGGDKFWILRLKANILGELGRFKEAIASAAKSTDLAKKEGNADYPRMNDKSISEWSKKK